MPCAARCTLTAIILAGALSLAACGGGGGSAQTDNPAPPPPPQSDPQIRVTGPTPFTSGCDGAPAAGTLFSGAEVEPMVAVNPKNPSNLIGVWQQDRWSSGASEGPLTGVSVDGGRTWVRRIPAFSRCTGGNDGNGAGYARATDPWVTFAPDGTAYQISLSLSGGSFLPDSENAILVGRSADGGQTWTNPVTLIRDGGEFLNDKESITADPTDARYVYAAWDRLAVSGNGPSYFTRTTDGGLTWEAARPIYDPGGINQTINNQIVVLPDGTLVNFFTRLDAAADGTLSATLAIVRSVDKGLTWSAPVILSPVQALGAQDPDTHVPIRDGVNLGSIAVGPHGELAAVWQDARFTGGQRDAVAFSRSLDGGLTWSTPARVNRDPSVQAFIPTVHVRDDGTIGVTYYDLRSNTSDPATLPTDYWLTRSTDGVTWLEGRVAGPFDLALAPLAQGALFLGDYQALTSIGPVFVPFYVQTNDGNPSNRTDVFATLASNALTAATLTAAEPQAAPAAMRAQAAEPLPMTPELRERLHQSVVRMMQRRVPGWTPRGIVPTTEAPAP